MERIATLEIQADLHEIPRVNVELERVMRACVFPWDDILDLQLAVEEAIANIIVHGYKGKAGTVLITIHATDRDMEVRIEDQAPPFNPLSRPDPDRESGLTDRQIGGLGIYLIQQVVDSVQYQYAGGKNILTLVKKTPG